MQRCAVILGQGRYANEREGYRHHPGPKLEFSGIADATDADIFSFSSASATRGHVFRTLFATRPLLGSVAHFASRAKDYNRCYVTGEDIGLPLALALKLRRWEGKIICVVHNITPKKARFIRAVGHDAVGMFIGLSARQREILVEQCGVPRRKTCAVYNWVDDNFFRPNGTPPNKGTPVFMSCGLENRDYDTLLRAAGKVDATFKIYGHGFFGSGSEKPLSPPNVEWMPRVSFDELRDAYASCDAVILPINNVDYAAGVTGLVEAMSAGKPVIASDSKGLEDYTRFLDQRFIAKPGDPASMARAANLLLSQPDLGQEQGLANRAWVLQNCALDKYIQTIKALMEL